MTGTERISVAEYRELVGPERRPLKATTVRPEHLGVVEAEVQHTIEQELTLRGWLWFHDQDARRNNAGLPDLICVHPLGVVAFLEVKSETGKLRPQQQLWRASLLRAGVEYHVVRPSNLDAVMDRLAQLVAEAKEES